MTGRLFAGGPDSTLLRDAARLMLPEALSEQKEASHSHLLRDPLLDWRSLLVLKYLHPGLLLEVVCYPFYPYFDSPMLRANCVQ